MDVSPCARLTIVGAGPAGIGLLIAASNSGRLHDLFAKRVTILDKEDNVGAGEIGGYDINSDSHADSFLRCLDAGLGERFPSLLRHPATLALNGYRGRAVPLRLAADFIVAVARPLQSFAARAGQPILTGMEALDATRTARGRWIVRARRNADGAEVNVFSHCLAIATGAEQSLARLEALSVAGQPLWRRYRDKLVLSRAILTKPGLDAARQRLAASTNPRVAIVGASHSAMSAANALLHLPGIGWQPRSVSILHRRPLRPMYPSPELARAEGFHAFGANDVCPRTGRVFPLAGFRSDARELLLRMMGLGGRPPEKRVQLVDLHRHAAGNAAECLERADLIVAATGYRPRALPLIDHRGHRIKLLSECFPGAAMVDDASRVLDNSARPIPGVFGIGLSAGFPLAGTHGEPSFRGEANGLALWHGEVGAAIVRAVLEDPAGMSDRAAPGHPARRPQEEAGGHVHL